jgi:hypothetical protein
MKWLIPFLFAGPVAAQSVNPCDWQASAQALVEPWEQNTRVFANGDVRLAAINTVEPANGAAYLLVLSPPRSELGERQCRVIGFTDQVGFAAVYFDILTADYDPAIGLLFDVPVQIVTADGGFSNGGLLSLTLNQSTGAMTTDMALGNE